MNAAYILVFLYLTGNAPVSYLPFETPKACKEAEVHWRNVALAKNLPLYIECQKTGGR